ncbi:MAG: hypothetical protein IKR40_03750 [Treponema sp.]|nr:hypothetical protein [Treponema sp.]
MDITEEFAEFCKNCFGFELRTLNDDNMPSFQIRQKSDDKIQIQYIDENGTGHRKCTIQKMQSDWQFLEYPNWVSLSQMNKVDFSALLDSLKGDVIRNFVK